MFDRVTLRRLRMPLTCVLVFSVITKWLLIHYGYPQQTHYDEVTILKDPLKTAAMYVHGDFSLPTSLYHWLLLLNTGLYFVFGWIAESWHDLHGFKEHLLSQDAGWLMSARILSLVVSTLGNLVFTGLAFRAARSRALAWVFTAFFVLNPWELNVCNFVKFDALAYLCYALVLDRAHRYFVEGQRQERGRLYLMLLLGLMVRVEFSGWLLGMLVCDLLQMRNHLPWPERLRELVRPALIGIAAYSVVTLAPVSVIYHLFFVKQQAITRSFSFEQGIVSQMPRDAGAVWQSISGSQLYLWCLLATMGPLLLCVVVARVFDRRIAFLMLPLAVNGALLVLFGAKWEHYLLAPSCLILVAHMVALEKWSRRRLAYWAAGFSLLWMGSWSLQFIYFAGVRDDVRIAALDHVRARSVPDDAIYVDGLFNGLVDSPERYAEQAAAVREVGGSTGLSLDYWATHLRKEDTRRVSLVGEYDFYAGTAYEGRFTVRFDTVRLALDRPRYYVYCDESYWRARDVLAGLAKRDAYGAFYHVLAKDYEEEAAFETRIADPRLRWRSRYYFRTVLILERKTR